MVLLPFHHYSHAFVGRHSSHPVDLVNLQYQQYKLNDALINALTHALNN